MSAAELQSCSAISNPAFSTPDSAVRHEQWIDLMETDMALDQNTAFTYEAEKKDLYEMGEIPPMGHV
ncbi:MAG: hypothetical protein ACSHWY_15700, partial [Octadecabacter sp.]